MTDDQGQIIRGWTTKPSCGLVVYQHILKNGGMTVLALLRSLGWTVLSHRGHHDEKNDSDGSSRRGPECLWSKMHGFLSSA